MLTVCSGNDNQANENESSDSDVDDQDDINNSKVDSEW